MNILFIYDAPLRPEAGGTERATSLVMNELSRRGHNCYGILHFDQQKPEEQYINGMKIDSIYNYLKSNNIDVVVNQIAFHSRFLCQFLTYGGQRWKEEGGKIISFMHLDPTPEPSKKLKTYFADWSQRSIMGKIKRLVYVLSLPYFYYKSDKQYKSGLRYLYDTSDRYVLMSKSFLPIFSKLANLSDTSKVVFIPNMLTFPEIATEEILEKKDNIVLVVARLDDAQKNISFMIDAWGKVKDHMGYALHILGDGQDRDMLHKCAEGVNDIVFEGSQTPLNWYRKAKILLMASPREGWGLTITESLQNGVVPVVLNTSTVFKDIINHGENGYLPKDSQEYIEYLEKLINEPKHREQMAKNGLKSATRFNPSSVGDLWQVVLDEIYVYL
ncbi:glycosyltransferase involved in cell wall biosynthesis [Flavobacterium sp. CG_9.1]|uniref:glycosyltransferase n=1 Tax=Flavobacterium sp. CG_9.1 TaxID=2787728 RepID=UPI0018C8EF6B|nr:glycosyltransferase [Flavobacterium sp. CG_9.1]MBG6062540.1 glycosyltransferase involved in cell wall biosynthesis [Flavobacterium sp. CG_9.1]